MSVRFASVAGDDGATTLVLTVVTATGTVVVVVVTRVWVVVTGVSVVVLGAAVGADGVIVVAGAGELMVWLEDEDEMGGAVGAPVEFDGVEGADAGAVWPVPVVSAATCGVI